ncbi:MAG: hypothetical protein H6719_23575 [Sandaracinaceae bacterium]|nr:hypothetical protein [Sandaracinaceae bacterium]
MELNGDTLIAPPPFVEVELVYEPGRPGMTSEDWCALQIWTQNTVYDVDWGMRCFGVSNAETGEPDPSNRLIGALLTGGQRRGESGLELTFPLPRPGNAAVFEVGEPPRADYVTTSHVKRVVLRLRVLTVQDEDSKPSWKRLSGAFRGTTWRGHEDPEGR